MPQTIMVFGATGFTGREVVRLACARGDRVIAHVRPDSPLLSHWKSLFESYGAKVDTTPWDYKDLKKNLLINKPDQVFSLLGTTKAREKKDSSSTYEAVDYGLTKIVIDALIADKLSPLFLYLSSMGSSAKAQGAYLKSRWKTEEMIKKSNIPYIIARPSLITGKRDADRALETVGANVFDAVLAGLGILGLRKIKNRYRSTSNTNLATALLNLTLDPSNKNKVFLSDVLQDVARS